MDEKAKVCAKCKWHATEKTKVHKAWGFYRKTEYKTSYICNHPNNFDIDIIDGELIRKENITYCSNHREDRSDPCVWDPKLNEAYCGIDGKWFEVIPIQEPPTWGVNRGGGLHL